MRNTATIKHFSYKTKNEKHTKKAPSKKNPKNKIFLNQRLESIVVKNITLWWLQDRVSLGDVLCFILY